MQHTPKLLSVVDLKTYFPMPKSSVFSRKRLFLRANENVTLDVYEGETLAIVGESGCGKSTLGRAILQLQRPTSGKVTYFASGGEIDLTKLNEKQMRGYRKQLQIVFQDPYSSLNPRMTVGRIIGEGAATHGYFKRNSKELENYVLGVMQDCGLQAHMYNRYPHEFSGGQRQRVCIARALALKPKFIVCDECVSALDVSIQSQILNLLQDLKEKEKLTYLFISHDLSVVRHISDRVAVMYLGQIMEEGETEQIFKKTAHPYTIALMSAVPKIDKRKKKEQIVLDGHMPNPVFPPSGCPFHTRCFMAQDICKRVPAPYQELEEGHFCRCHFASWSEEEKRNRAKQNEQIGN